MCALNSVSMERQEDIGKAKARRPRLDRRRREFVRRAVVTLLILPGAIFVLLPFWWMISTSLKDPRYIWIIPPQWIPNPVRWSNYVEAIQRRPILLLAKNTAFITFVNIVGNLLTSTLVAYGFGRLRFRGRDILFTVMLATMMLPGQVTLIPVFILFTRLGLMNTYWPLTIGSYIGASPFQVFMLRQFIMTIPLELDDAARIDGCGSLRIYWNIILPLIKPALALITIFTFFGNWNDFFWPLIVLNDMDKYTLSLGLHQFVRTEQYGGTDYHLMMAYATLIMLPCVIVFFVTQKYMIRGVVLRASVG